MVKTIKSYYKHGEHCGIAKQVEGKTVDAVEDSSEHWHFEVDGVKWVASNYAFEEGEER